MLTSSRSNGAWGVAIMGIAAAWAIALWGRPIVVPEATAAGSRSDQARLWLDPNVASAGELAAITGLGEKHAEDIVAYREQFAAAHPGQIAFTGEADLARARGIGSKTAQLAGAYLVFSGPLSGAADSAVAKRKPKT